MRSRERAGDGAGATRFVERSVPSSDGLDLMVDDAGPEDAPALIFIHGIAQSRGSWRSVLRGPLARRYRLVAYDMRGHGGSAKPTDPALYAEEGRLGRDLEAVGRGLGLDRFALVPWSYGGAVVGDYLRTEGDARVAGILTVAASVRLGRSARAYFGPAMMDNVRGLMSDDPEAYRRAAAAFIEGCSRVPPLPAMIEAILAPMLRVPAVVRRTLLMRDEDYVPSLVQSRAPLTLLHGALDQVVLPSLSRDVQVAAPRAKLVVMPDVGHAPFVEARAAFDEQLEAFVRSVF